MMTKITVVTITYNAEAVLQRTLDSVLRQTHLSVEHLIIDGASTDKTVAMAKAYKQRSDISYNGHEVIVISEPDRGIYDAMNKGIKRATGDYIVFMNAGDCFHSDDTLEHIAMIAESSDDMAGDSAHGLAKPTLPGVIYGDTDIVDGEGQFLYHRRLTPPRQLTWRSFRNGMRVCHQAFYARTDIARQTPYDLQYRYSADVDWCIRVMKKAGKMELPLVNAHEVVADYLEEGTTTRHHRESLKERFHVMCHHYGRLSTLFMHAWFVVRSVFHR